MAVPLSPLPLTTLHSSVRMDPSHHSELSYPTYDDFGFFRPYEIYSSFEPHRLGLPDQCQHSLPSHNVPVGYRPGMLPIRYTSTFNPVGIFPARDNWHHSQTV